MRVCFVSHTANRNGAELALLELLQGLSKSGVQCLVFVPRKGPLLIELTRLNIEWRILGYPWWWKPWRRSLPHRVLRTLKSLVASVRMAIILVQWRCDLVYTNTVASSTGALAARLARKPHVWHLHESGYRNSRMQFDLGAGLAARLINRLSALIIVVSRAVADDYSRYINSERMHVVYQSVTLHYEGEKANDLKHDNSAFQCVVVGSLQPWKGQAEAITALAEVVHRGVDAHLLLVGGGEKSYLAELHRQVEDHGLEQRVTFTGYVNDPMQFIRMADVILMCSRWEAFGRVTVEAMLAGKAVIASARGGTIEQIEDGKTGLLYECGNPFELAEKIQYLYENPGLRLKLGQAAHTWAADRFTQERYAKEMLDLFTQVLVKEKTPVD
ncbi:MAG: glycosyltransferase family 4 protein [Nitrosospira sp.]|nr:glycosyltransferase family 4 protein [Nitrosospira sp.]